MAEHWRSSSAHASFELTDAHIGVPAVPSPRLEGPLDEYGFSALHWAALLNLASHARLLRNAGAPVRLPAAPLELTAD